MKNSINSLCFKSIVGQQKNEPLGPVGRRGGGVREHTRRTPLPTGLLPPLVCFSPTILAVRTRALEGRGGGVAVHIKIENTNYAMEGASGL